MELLNNVSVQAHRKHTSLRGATTATSLCIPMYTILLLTLLSPARDQVHAAHFVATTRTLVHQKASHKVPQTDPSHQETGDSSGNHGPLELFEVSKPADIARGATEVCGHILLHHVFGNTIKEPPIVRPYSANCKHRSWSHAVLKWKASSTGRQYDRISAVWLGGVEILRTCTAEPVKQPGIEWTVEKDVTRFSSLWKRRQILSVELANVVDEIHTGSYNVTLSVHFYASDPKSSTSAGYGGDDVADVVLPFPRSGFSSEHWFRIRDEGDVLTRKMNIPRNAYKAVIEVCVSFHELDEFWYINPPNEYNKANNLTDDANGAFREILVTIDGLLAGVVYPFPVIYTGGVNPYFWRPVSGIGSFVLPSYDVDITPFLGRLVKGEDGHEFRVSITNALPSWLLALNLHVWIDKKSRETRGEMVSHFDSSSTSKRNSEILLLDGTFLIKTSRLVSYSGWLVSSFGNLTTSVECAFRFSHILAYSDRGNAISVRQESVSEKKMVVRSDERSLVHEQKLWKFPLRLSVRQKLCRKEDYVIKASIDHAWEEERSRLRAENGGISFFSSLKNRQQSQGKLLVPPNGEIRGVATTKQSLVYDSSGGCYFRSLGVTNNGSFLFDHSDTRCT
ncbi:hypothetical protein M758_9G094300 [Ceratodon purpureus]|nr:hypothetical protein M758_9G094300 [Ceratodon purpureus]